MKIIIPKTVDDTTLLSSSVPADDYPAWTAGDYVTGDRVIIGELAYEALTSTSDDPEVGVTLEPASWLKLGAINKYRMFRGGTDSVTEHSNSDLVVDFQFTDGLVNSLALFNIVAESVQVVVTDSVEGEVYNTEVQPADYAVGNFYDFFFQPYRQKKTFSFTDLPPYIGATIKVVLKPYTGVPVSCGILTLGKAYTIGSTQNGTSVGLRDFTIRERDGFGNLVEGASKRKVKKGEFDILVQTSEIDRIQDIFSELDTPAAFLGTDLFDSTRIYGIPLDFNTTFQSNELSECSLELVGY